MCVGFFNLILWNIFCASKNSKSAIEMDQKVKKTASERLTSGSESDGTAVNTLKRRSKPTKAEILSRRSSLSRKIAIEVSGGISSSTTPAPRRRRQHTRIPSSLSSSPTTTVDDFLAGEFQTSCLKEIRHELGYQGKQLARIVRDIHLNHEASVGGEENIALHGLEMVLSEIRNLRNELNGHKNELAELRSNINLMLNAEGQREP